MRVAGGLLPAGFARTRRRRFCDPAMGHVVRARGLGGWHKVLSKAGLLHVGGFVALRLDGNRLNLATPAASRDLPSFINVQCLPTAFPWDELEAPTTGPVVYFFSLSSGGHVHGKLDDLQLACEYEVPEVPD